LKEGVDAPIDLLAGGDVDFSGGSFPDHERGFPGRRLESLTSKLKLIPFPPLCSSLRILLDMDVMEHPEA
jgi:hypothetical protein